MTITPTPTDMLPTLEPIGVKEALRRRKALEDRRDRIQGRRDQIGVRFREIASEADQVEAEKAEATLAAVNAGKAAPAGDFRARRAALAAEQLDLEGELTASGRVLEEIELQLHYLHCQHFEDFAEHAETIGAEAVKLLQQLEPAYRKAFDRWDVARREWARLVKHHNEGRTRPGPSMRPDGSYRTNDDAVLELSGPVMCPLRQPGEVFSGVNPRPPEIGVEDDDDSDVLAA